MKFQHHNHKSMHFSFFSNPIVTLSISAKEMEKIRKTVKKMKKIDMLFDVKVSPKANSGVTIRPHIMQESTIWTEIQDRLNESDDLQKFLVKNG